MDHLSFEQGDFEKQKAIFERHFSGILEQIGIDQIPEEVMKKFEGYSARFISPQDYKEKNFDSFFKITHDNKDETYIAKQLKELANADEKIKEEDTYFIDTRDQFIIGNGELRFDMSLRDGGFLRKPFIGYTGTTENYQRQGLGVRRIEVMNAFSEMHYNSPVYSDSLLSPSAEKVWEFLQTSGHAEKIQEGDLYRFRYIE